MSAATVAFADIVHSVQHPQHHRPQLVPGPAHNSCVLSCDAPALFSYGDHS